MHFVLSQPLRAPALLLLSCLIAVGIPEEAHAQREEAIGPYLSEIEDLARQALEASRSAEEAASISEVKQQADAVFTTIWGIPSGLAGESGRGAARVHGWKTRWQVTFADFDSAFAARYGSVPPEIDDPSQLGIVGRGRHARAEIERVMADADASDAVRTHGLHVVHSLNNVIGWMKMDDGVTKGERQPRVDLTREWDSPIEFWMSTADTGWLHEVFSQALNILKTRYDGDLELARRHAADMSDLIMKSLEGVDANENGSVEPAKMEGGIETAIQHAGFAGYLDP